MTNRRSFLALLGIGSVSAPLAAKQTLELEQSKLAGIAANVLSGEGVGGLPESGDDIKTYEAAARYVQLFGVPKHVEQRAKEHSQYVRYLDPDIVCKRSWSLCVKIQEQKQRNYEREMAHYRDMNWYGRAQSAFEKISGFKWPW